MKIGQRYLGQYLAERRQNLNLTQAQISNRIGFESHMMISYIERGMNPIASERVRAFADAYELDPMEFYFWWQTARWVDEEVPADCILYIVGDPEFDPAATPSAPNDSDSPRPPGRLNHERGARTRSRFFGKLFDYIREQEATRARLKKAVEGALKMVVVVFSLVLIRSIVERRYVRSSRTRSTGSQAQTGSFFGQQWNARSVLLVSA